MISAAELRILQQSYVVASQKAKEDRFRNACEKYFDILVTEGQRGIEMSKSSSRTSYILSPERISQKVDGYQYSTLLYGLWNRTTRQFDSEIFAKNEVEKPFDRAVTYFANFGYKLENISDSSKSFSLFIKLSW